MVFPPPSCQPGRVSRLSLWFFSGWGWLLNQPDLSFEEIRKRKLYAILLVPGVCILFAFAFHHLLRGNVVEGLLDLSAGVWLLLSLATLRRMKKGLAVYRLNTAILGLLFIFLAVKGGVHGNKLMWVFSFPLIAFYTLGKKEGAIWNGAVLLLLVGVLYLPGDLVSVHVYAPEFKIRFWVAFFLVSSLTYIYESGREQFQGALEEANRALERGAERLKRAQSIARVGNLEYDVRSGLVSGSEEALRILGIEPAGPVFPLSVLKPLLPDFEAFRKQFEERIRRNRELDLDLTIRRPSDGKEIVLRARAELLRSPSGEPERVIGVIQDISDRRQAELERCHLEDRLARSQKMEALGVLAGGVAHDLNNVLSGVVGYPDLLLADLPPESPLFAPLSTIKDSGQKAAAIVQDLLTLARRGVSSQKVLDLNDLIEEYLASPEHEKLRTFHPGVTFEACLEPRLLHVKGSPVHLKKALMNLVANAAEALPVGGSVRIRTENRCVEPAASGCGDLREGEHVVLQVEDDGMGISAQDLGRIFEPFYTKKKMGRSGTGLGLAVVWGTVQDHRGHVHVESAEGHGTRMDVFLPVTRERSADESDGIPLDAYLGKGETILVVDDVAEQRELAKRMLEKLNYVVHALARGEDAPRFLSGQPADLVVLDMIMEPGIDGLETYSRILLGRPAQRALIVSGFSATERVRAAQRLGAASYVKKPYTLETLGLAVRQALVRRPNGVEAEKRGPSDGPESRAPDAPPGGTHP